MASRPLIGLRRRCLCANACHRLMIFARQQILFDTECGEASCNLLVVEILWLLAEMERAEGVPGCDHRVDSNMRREV